MVKALQAALPVEKKQELAGYAAALEAVQPPDLTAAEIGVRIGASWVPTDVYQQFMFELFGTSVYARQRMRVVRSEYSGEWNISNKSMDGGNIKAVQGNTGHATTGILMDTYAHTQDKPRLELAEKLEADFYSQDIGSPKSGSVPVKENLPDSIQITPEGMLKVVRQMNPEQRREFTRLLFA